MLLEDVHESGDISVRRRGRLRATHGGLNAGLAREGLVNDLAHPPFVRLEALAQVLTHTGRLDTGQPERDRLQVHTEHHLGTTTRLETEVTGALI